MDTLRHFQTSEFELTSTNEGKTLILTRIHNLNDGHQTGVTVADSIAIDIKTGLACIREVRNRQEGANDFLRTIWTFENEAYESRVNQLSAYPSALTWTTP